MTLLRSFLQFLGDLLRSRRLIWDLTKNDFRTKYLSSYLGIFWAFVNPVVSILILWFVFQVGFKSTSVEKVPFILWLLCGIVPWFFFAEALSSATQAVTDNSHLVKKVVFRVSVLPIIKILSALIIHVVFVGILAVLYLLYGYTFDLHSLQVVYYLLATIVLLLGLSWITSSIVVFVRDVGQLVTVLLQFGFWLTPIFWAPGILPEKYQPVVSLNPFYYIVDGYRASLLYKTWFWQDMGVTLYFWAVTGLIFVAGALLFNRLRPHFADVL